MELIPLYVLPPGTKILLGSERDTGGTILSVRINPGNAIIYECVWWIGLEFRQMWLSRSDFSIDDVVEKLPIGFASK
jgi:hypothetical protein